MSKVVISYSHKDERWLRRLLVHLRPVEKTGRVDLWADTRIKPGEDWSAQIASALAEADIALLLVSADFLASEFITSKELPPLLRAAKLRACRVLPVIVGPCLFSRIQNLQQFQAINSPGRPLASMKTAEAEKTLAEVAVTVLDYVSSGHVGDRASSAGTRRKYRDQQVQPKTVGNPQIDGLISRVRLGDWDSAEEAALQVIALTDSSGKNPAFQALLGYQNCPDDDDRLMGALHTIECCAHLAPWLINHGQLSRLAGHKNVSVRSAAASICTDLAHSCPDRVPLDLLLGLSVYNEDWYVQAPANAALKAMARSFPGVLRVLHMRLQSANPEETAHAAAAMLDVAKKEPELLDANRLHTELERLRRIGHKDASIYITTALSRLKGVAHKDGYRYGL